MNTPSETQQDAVDLSGAHQALLVQFLESMSSVGFIKDTEGHYLLVNRAYERVVGVERDALPGKTDYDLFPAQLAEQFRRHDVQVQAEGRPCEFEEHLPMPDGRRHTFLSLKFPLRDDSGAVFAVGGVSTDITARVEHEEALALSEQRFRSLVEHSPEAFMIFDAARGRFVDANENAARLFRLPLDQLLDRSITDLSPPVQPDGRSSEEKTREKIAATLAGQQPIFEWTILTADGELVPCLFWTSLHPAKDEMLVRASMLDLRNQRRAEKILRFQSRMLEQTQSVAQVGGWELDLRGRTLIWTPQTYRLFDLRMVEFSPDPAEPFPCLAPPQRRLVAEAIGEASELGKPFDLELPIHTPRGRRSWVRILANVEFHGGRPVKLYGSIQDVTRRRSETEQRERLIADLARKNAELEQYAHTASHDLKTPLVTIKLSLGIVARALERGQQDRVELELERISRAADRIDRLLSDLLELSRAGRLFASLKEVPIGELVQSARELLSSRIRAQGIAVRVAPDLPKVRCDPEQLEPVFVNLIENAIKFMGDQSDPLIEIGRGQSRGRSAVFVRDNGIGIDPKFHDKVFGLFERIDPEIEGTGMGLSIVRRIVEAHGGQVWVESGSGVGCTFWIAMPFVE